jgi:hypothetical protein
VRNLSLLVVEVSLAAFLGGCCVNVHCGDCDPAIQLAVVDASTGSAVANVALSASASGSCSTSENVTLCEVHAEAGSYIVTLSAPGYQSAAVGIEVAESDSHDCCDCGYVPVTRTVQLLPSA